jgi:uncharacterized protein YcsI (UPF0317 family)
MSTVQQDEMDMEADLDGFAEMTPFQLRQRYRDGLCVPTAGAAQGFTQVNLVSVPEQYAFDFMLYASRNAKACPVLDVVEAGQVESVLAHSSDLRTDLPKYRIWENGEVVQTKTDVVREWEQHPDLVTFLIGCSFSFEARLLEAGIPLRYIEEHKNVSMYRTNIECRPAGVFSGPMVVSMRPIRSVQVPSAVVVTSKLPSVHGAPVCVGNPASIGIEDIEHPDYGDPISFHEDELPVFWACGVTPQAALARSKIPFAITHAPGYMLVTDVPSQAYVI